MLINEVVSKVGISRKTIRYYEEEGLVCPIRNKNNEYREYDEKEINLLKKIKFLRNLNVPIKDIKSLEDGKLTLEDCLNNCIQKIEDEENKFSKIKIMCLNMLQNKEKFENMNVDTNFIEMNKLNKEGFTMQKSDFKKKKIIGAVVSSSIFGLFLLSILASIILCQIFSNSKIPIIIFIVLSVILLLPIISLIYNLISRIKEINGGEEDEASKY